MSSATAIPPTTQDPHAPSRCWTRKDVAAYFAICEVTVSRWTEEGRLPQPRRIGRRLFWDPETVRTSIMGLPQTRAAEA
jgi:predicted DNA-binding transcriptional regulator AlpA